MILTVEAMADRVVMAGHSRPKDGAALLAYVPAIHVFAAGKARMPGTMGERRRAVLFERLSPGMTADMPDSF